MVVIFNVTPNMVALTLSWNKTNIFEHWNHYITSLSDSAESGNGLEVFP